MRQRRKVIVVCLAGAALVAIGMSPAGSTPIDFPRGTVLDGTCAEEPVSATPVPGRGIWTPYRLETGQVLVPYQLKFDLLEPPKAQKTRHDSVIFGVTYTKGGGVPDDAITCEFAGSYTANGTEHFYSAVITGVVRG